MRPRVWAPAAARVELDRPGRGRAALARSDKGWWVGADDLAPGTDYGFVVDGEGPFPDPRSAWQPDGVHGPSRVVAHAAFRWTDAGWQPPPLAGGAVYELHVGTFTPEGTFDAAIARLPDLVDLGVTHVELMPVAAFPGAHGWGYDGVASFAVHAPYGGPDGLKRLVDACHGRGLAVLLDVVYNHLGPDGNYLGRFGPYFTDRYRTPWGQAVNLDGPGSDEVRRYIIDNALGWLRDYHLDGLRLDAVHALFDLSARHVLEELAAEVAALEARLGRHLTLVAESDQNDPRLLRPPEAGGFGLPAQWSDDLHHALHAALTGERTGYYEDFGRLEHVARALEGTFVYAGDYSLHRDRRHGQPPTGLPGWRFVTCLQNHDQVGNRARGDRLGHGLSPDRLKVGAALLLAGPFTPLLFQGEEWAASAPFPYFCDHQDPALAAAVREGRRREFAAFGWRPEDVPDPQDPATFRAARLDWAERARAPHAEVLAWYRALLRLRRDRPDLRDGRPGATRARFDEAAGWLVVERPATTLAVNLGAAIARVPLGRGERRVVLSSRESGVEVGDEGVVLPPDTATFLV
ncbi:MAG: malto-oligosyltrehalose trehalohydrolase [Planctomycetes bacterium]|nr:malto-oligosyltrehalose trehalohydrolase [Planctomycetota bacterium]